MFQQKQQEMAMAQRKTPSQGTALVHNLIAGSFTWVGDSTDNGTGILASNRYRPYHVPHRTEVAGFMTILHGDARFYNNIFVQQPVREDLTDYVKKANLEGYPSAAWAV